MLHVALWGLVLGVVMAAEGQGDRLHTSGGDLVEKCDSVGPGSDCTAARAQVTLRGQRV